MYDYGILLSVEGSELVFAIIIILIVILIAVGMVVALVALSRRKTQLYHTEKENMQLQFNEQLLNAQIEIQEETLLHISRELHDNFGQVASLIKINLHSIVVEPGAGASNNLEEAQTLTRQLLTDIKSLASSLNSENIVRLGLPAAIQRETDRINRMGKVQAFFSQEGEFPDFSNEQVIILFRMFQELMNNMLKYSEASEFKVHIQMDEPILKIDIRDNGIGFDLPKARAKDSSGLHNLQKRAELLGASLSTITAPGRGVHTSIQIPLPHTAA